MKIIKDEKYLKKTVSNKASAEEGKEISDRLFAELKTQKFAIGLAANQVGIDKRVCVVNVKEPRYFVNPEIVEKSKDKVVYREFCLSVPKKRGVLTARHTKIKVRADNLANEIEFGPDVEKLTADNIYKDEGLLECIAIQHEIDHLDGKLITDRGTRLMGNVLPKVRSEKIPRNKKVMLEHPTTKETVYLKFKEAGPYLNKGYKVI